MSVSGSEADSGDQSVNEVLLRGRISAEPEERTLPSGDQIITWRLVVQRPLSRRSSRARVDTIDCTAWSAAARRSSARMHAGDQVEVRGALRRHFRSSAGGATSRVDVEVTTVRRLRRAAVTSSPPAKAVSAAVSAAAASDRPTG
jgi:single-strand DNA-binding protein